MYVCILHGETGGNFIQNFLQDLSIDLMQKIFYNTPTVIIIDWY